MTAPAAPADRVRLSAWALFGAFLRRDWAVARSYRANFFLTLGGSVLNMALFFTLGRLVDRAGTTRSTGFAAGYFSYLVLGVALLEMAQIAIASVASKLRLDQMNGTLEAVLTTPTPAWASVVAGAVYELLQAACFALVQVVLALIFFGVRFHAGPAQIPVVVVTVIAVMAFFGAVGIVVAAFTLVLKQTLALVGLAGAALGLLSTVYYPLATVPPGLRTLARLNPFTLALDVLRAALLGGQSELGRLAILAAAAAVTVPMSLAILRAALDRARRAGTLGQY